MFQTFGPQTFPRNKYGNSYLFFDELFVVFGGYCYYTGTWDKIRNALNRTAKVGYSQNCQKQRI